MFENYKSRMAHKGSTQSEMLRMQSNMVIEQTWDRDPNYRRVYVVKVNHGLPIVTEKHELIDVKFNVDVYQKVGSDEPAYHLQFRHGAEKFTSDIGIGSYVYMADEDDEWKWWLITSFDERPQFRQYTINECNWELGWVCDGKIYHHLGVLREGSSGDIDENSYTSTVDGTLTIWLPTTDDSATIGYNQRFLISDERRITPLAWETSRIVDTHPFGLTKLKMKQATFDHVHDNAELMLANYYDSEIPPVESKEEISTNQFAIIHNGTKAAVKVGGSEKVFTAQLPEDNYFDIQWSISDGEQTYDCTYENNTWTFGDYTITTADRTMRLKVASNYDLIGTILTVKAKCADGNTGELQVEVVG
jgi:hypothetical protein